MFSLKPYTAYGWYPTGPAVHVLMNFQGDQRFYAFGVANGKKEHYYFYSDKKRKKKGSKKWKQNIDAKMTLNFLKRINKKYRKLLLIWDKSANHKASTVQQYVKFHDIKQEWFPTACPDENPMEQAWDFLKEATANDYHQTIHDYRKATKKQARKKPLVKMFKYLTV